MRSPYAKIFYDKLTLNYQLASPALYNLCKFIYVLRGATSIEYIVDKGYSEECAFNYYTFRLRRIYELATKAPGLLLTWENLISGQAFPTT